MNTNTLSGLLVLALYYCISLPDSFLSFCCAVNFALKLAENINSSCVCVCACVCASPFVEPNKEPARAERAECASRTKG